MEIHRYQLIDRGAFSKAAIRGSAARHGALVRFKFEDGEVGHADLFAWPELGDASLGELLEALAAANNRNPTNLKSVREELSSIAKKDSRFLLLPRLIDAANAEAESLRNHRPLVDGSIANHFTALSASCLAPGDVLDARRGGFPAIKVKIARAGGSIEDLVSEAHALGRLQSHWDISLRLDANEYATPDGLKYFLDSLPIRLRESIEWIEDPFPFSLRGWADFSKEMGIRLSIDRPVMRLLGGLSPEGSNKSLEDVFTCGAAQVMVHKPAWLDDDIAAAATKLKIPVVVTSALGHPVGNLFAASVAARISPDETHGCFTHTVYRDDEISNSLVASKQVRGSRIFGVGEGLGLPAKALSRIKWETLS